MEGAVRHCFVEILAAKYRRSSKGTKGAILGEVVEKLGVGRRQARRLMEPLARERPRKRDNRGRPSRYGDVEFRAALRYMWQTTRYMCSRHLKAAMPEWLPYVEAERGVYAEEIRKCLLSISAATIDRILKPYKALKGKSLTRSGTFREQIPIQENIWDIKIPGYFEADTVAHCGGSTMGEYINSLTMVDSATIWTECRAVFSKASGPIVTAIEDIEAQLPFEILGYDADNGTEVLNQHILRYFRDERIERNKKPVSVTRSREYRKNDNAHVEQRNDSVARRWLGYERLDYAELLPLVNHYLRNIVCPLMNHFFPAFKLTDKIRTKCRTRRVYKDPITPYLRVMKSDHVSQERKDTLAKIHASLNPLLLCKQEKHVRKQIDSALKQLRIGKLRPLLSKLLCFTTIALTLQKNYQQEKHLLINSAIKGLCSFNPGIFRLLELPVVSYGFILVTGQFSTTHH